MALMDREYVREAPAWHLGATRVDAVRGSRHDYEKALAISRSGSRAQQDRGQPSRSVAFLALFGLLCLLVVLACAWLVVSGFVTITYVPGS